MAGQVGRTVAREHAFEKSQVGGNTVGQRAVGAGGQIQAAAQALLCFKIREQGLVVGQVGDIEFDALGDLALQSCFAFENPSRNAHERMAVRADHD